MGNIVWLASYPKSGNTWLRAFLANLVAGGDAPVPLADLPQYCDDEARPEFFTAAAGRPSTTLSFDEICALRPRVHAAIAARSPGTRLVKTHNCAGFVERHPLHAAAVTAGAIYVVRDPRDVAVSLSHHFGLELDAAIERLGDDRVATRPRDCCASTASRRASSAPCGMPRSQACRRRKPAKASPSDPTRPRASSAKGARANGATCSRRGRPRGSSRATARRWRVSATPMPAEARAPGSRELPESAGRPAANGRSGGGKRRMASGGTRG